MFIAHLKLGKYTSDISTVLQNGKKMSELLEVPKVDEKLNQECSIRLFHM